MDRWEKKGEGWMSHSKKLDEITELLMQRNKNNPKS